MSVTYTLPVTDAFDFRDVTEQNFDVTLYPQAYVDLGSIRKTEKGDYDLFRKIAFTLNFKDGKYVHKKRDSYNKMIFSGHLGTGKSAELFKLHEKISSDKLQPSYLCVFIKMDTAVDLGNFKTSDFLPMLIFHLMQTANKTVGLDIKSIYSLLADTLGNVQETKAGVGGVDMEVSLGFLQLNFKDFYWRENQGKQIRERFNNNPHTFVARFNEILDKLRKTLYDREILFVIDGSEKMLPDVYKQIFVDNRELVLSIRALMLVSVPILTHFNIQHAAMANFYDMLPILPMFKITEEDLANPQSLILQKHRELLKVRADYEQFIGEEALVELVRYSGGCIRQFFNLLNETFTDAEGGEITKELIFYNAKEQGRRMFERLTSSHLKIIKEGKFDSADPEVASLMYSLTLLKYNGHREINPLLRLYLDKNPHLLEKV
jgi:hypothetical protein